MSAIPSPDDAFPSPPAPPPSPRLSAARLIPIRAAITSLLHQPSYDDGSAGPVLVRLAWHSAGTYDAATNTGGSNGAGMRYEKEGGDPANAGLQHARAFLEPVKHQFPWITYADLWTLAAVVAIREMGGPEIPWQGGRTDFTDDSKVPPRGRLPDATQGVDHLRAVFYKMGFNDQEIVALSGAHNMGRCHADRSGFEGKWVNNPTRFSNTYFKLLRMHDWKKKRLPNGAEQFVYVEEPDEDQLPQPTTTGSDAADEDLREELMMLPTDIALLHDPHFRVWVDRYADDKALFFEHFSAVFAKLLELGITRDTDGTVLGDHNTPASYRSAPKKSDALQCPHAQQQGGGCPVRASREHGSMTAATSTKRKNNDMLAKL